MLSTPGALDILEVALESPPRESVQRLVALAIVFIEQVVEVQANELGQRAKAPNLERFELQPPSTVRRISAGTSSVFKQVGSFSGRPA